MAQVATLGQWIKKRREELALSQSGAPRKAGVGRTTWVNWEKGLSTPERHRYVLIERTLKWEPGSVEAILEGGEPQPARIEHSPPEAPRLLMNPEVLNRLEPADREALLAVVRAFEARATWRHSKEVKQQREDPKGA